MPRPRRPPPPPPTNNYVDKSEMETPTLVLVMAVLALAAALYYRSQPAVPQRRAARGGVRTVVVPRSALMAANEARPSAFAPAMVGSSGMSAGFVKTVPSYARTSATTGVRCN